MNVVAIVIIIIVPMIIILPSGDILYIIALVRCMLNCTTSKCKSIQRSVSSKFSSIYLYFRSGV